MSDKSNTNASAKSGGIGFWGLLQVMLIGLKLTGYISWSWVWVLAPAIAVAVIAGAMILGAGIMLLIAVLKAGRSG
jgi:hypothetical protein